MRMFLAAAALLTPTAALADITVLTSGGTQPALKALAEQWTKETGKKVKIVDGTVTFTVDNVVNKVPGDLVVLPSPKFEELKASYRPGTTKPVGRAYFGLAQKAGLPKPDISTLPKFVSVLNASKSVGYTDPKSGSAAGTWVAQLLARPEYAGVRQHTVVGMPGWAIPRDGAQYAIGPLPEEVTIPGVEAVGQLPKEISKHFDYTVAVLKVANQPKEAADFIAYATSAKTRAVWKKTGVEPN